ncbi:hypothetical protein KA529_01185 [Candidatus Saccharibacteria bacterium]|nr:hypothetical protein [Candidatus Saccharibacteria bacterium]
MTETLVQQDRTQADFDDGFAEIADAEVMREFSEMMAHVYTTGEFPPGMTVAGLDALYHGIEDSRDRNEAAGGGILSPTDKMMYGGVESEIDYDPGIEWLRFASDKQQAKDASSILDSLFGGQSPFDAGPQDRLSEPALRDLFFGIDVRQTRSMVERPGKNIPEAAIGPVTSESPVEEPDIATEESVDDDISVEVGRKIADTVGSGLATSPAGSSPESPHDAGEKLEDTDTSDIGKHTLLAMAVISEPDDFRAKETLFRMHWDMEGAISEPDYGALNRIRDLTKALSESGASPEDAALLLDAEYQIQVDETAAPDGGGRGSRLMRQAAFAEAAKRLAPGTNLDREYLEAAKYTAAEIANPTAPGART